MTTASSTPLSLLRARFTGIWFVLIAATLLSFWLGTDHGIDSPQARSILIFLVAFVKVRLVGLYFMELKDAPLALRLILEAYCVLICAAVISFYLFA